MKRIVIEFIDHRYQRYPTWGDYFETAESILFRISRFENPAFSQAVLIHELVEKFLNDQRGIRDVDVDAWDLAHPELDDPGLHPDAPYHATHMLSDCLERAYILMTGNDWNDYEEATPCAE
jgi:hypothetical protein